MAAIEREQAQLPPDHPNLIVIENTRLFLSHNDVRHLISALEETVFSHASVAAAVITGAHGGFGNAAELVQQGHSYRRYGRFDDIQAHHCMLLHNRFAAVPLPDACRERLEFAFAS